MRGAPEAMVAVGLGVLALAFGAVHQPPELARYEPPEEPPVRAIFRESGLGAEATGGRERVYRAAKFTEHTVSRYERNGPDWREDVIASTDFGNEPGDYEEFVQGIHRSLHAGTVTEERSKDLFVPSAVFSTASYRMMLVQILRGELRQAETGIPCGDGMLCGRLTRRSVYSDEDTPFRGYYSIPLEGRNVFESTTLYDQETKHIRHFRAMYNGMFVSEFVAYCIEPGPDPCGPEDEREALEDLASLPSRRR